MKNSKSALIFLSLLCSGLAEAQNTGIDTKDPKSTLEIAGSIGLPITVMSSNSHLTLTTKHFGVEAKSGDTITLPTASGAPRRVYCITFNTASGSDTIATVAGDTIMLQGNKVKGLSLTGGTLLMQSDSNYWYASILPAYVAPSTSGNVMTSNGSTWTSSAPSSLIGIPTWAIMTTSDTNSRTTLRNISGLSVALATGSTYEFEAHFSTNTGTAANSKNGVNYAIHYSGTGTTTVSGTISGASDYGATGHSLFQKIPGLDSVPGPNPYVAVQNVDGGITIYGIIVTGTIIPGNLTIEIRAVGPVQSGYIATTYSGGSLKATKIR